MKAIKVLVLVSILIFSCKKEKDLPTPVGTVQIGTPGTVIKEMYLGSWVINGGGTYQNIDTLYQYNHFSDCRNETVSNLPQQLTFIEDTMFFVGLPNEWLYTNGDDTLRIGSGNWVSPTFYTKCQ